MGITNDTYYEMDEYMTVSQFKRFQRCELDAMRPFDNSNKSVPMMVGSYVDAYVEGTLDEFKKNNPEIFLKSGKNKGELRADYVQADKICEFIDNDPVFSQFMSGEKQGIYTFEIAGVPFKMKVDSYSPDIAINDLKVMRTVTDRDGNYYDFITPWGYDIQMAVYQEGIYQNFGTRLPAFICAVTKETPINSVIVEVEQDYLNRALYTVESNVQHYYDVKMGRVEPVGCGVCATCIGKRKATEIVRLSSLV